MITVIGSLNIDLLVSVPQLAKMGETILCDDFETAYGGKGGNQAIAAAKLGADVQFIGAVGNDNNAQMYKSHLMSYNIDVSHIKTCLNNPTGMAIVTLANNDNSIIVIPGANLQLSAQDVKQLEQYIAKSDVLLLQFEVSDDVIACALEIAKAYGIPVILNPAPFREFPIEWLDVVTYCTPNETEYNSLIASGMDMTRYKHKFIVTQGGDGVFWYDDGEKRHVNVPKVNVVDTTGAGDTFNGALANFMTSSETLEQAIKKSVVAASLSTQQKGAQNGMPTLDQLNQFLGE